MLFRQRFLDGIARGEISLAFRRWRRPTVKAGGRLRTAIGELAILAVDTVEERDITELEARQAGYPSRDDLLRELATGREGTLYRIKLRLAGQDPRIALREQASLSDDEHHEIQRRLERYDSSSTTGPWTFRLLRLIAERPEVRANDLARAAGYEKDWLKVQVRKLKNLGLTESLALGYRLSPRGQAVLDRMSRETLFKAHKP